MQDCDEAYVCLQLMEHVQCIQRCLTNSVEKLQQNPEELNLQKYHDILEEVIYLRSQVIGAVNVLRSRLEGVEQRLQAKKQQSSPISSLNNIESDLCQNLVIKEEESEKQEEDGKQQE